MWFSFAHVPRFVIYYIYIHIYTYIYISIYLYIYLSIYLYTYWGAWAASNWGWWLHHPSLFVGDGSVTGIGWASAKSRSRTYFGHGALVATWEKSVLFAWDDATTLFWLFGVHFLVARVHVWSRKPPRFSRRFTSAETDLVEPGIWLSSPDEDLGLVSPSFQRNFLDSPWFTEAFCS